jgi:hypothetical protein
VSQHLFPAKYKDQAMTVLAGWDRPLQQFFMVIELDAPTDDMTDEEVYLYSNLFDPNSVRKDLDYFTEKLKEFGITLPNLMLDEIRKDCAQNIGNRQCVYGADGQLKEPQRQEE